MRDNISLFSAFRCSDFALHFDLQELEMLFSSIVSADSDKLRSQVSHYIFKLYLTSGCVHPCFRNVDFTRSAVILSGNRVRSYD